jgi:type I restriction enzyme S subunit
VTKDDMQNIDLLIPYSDLIIRYTENIKPIFKKIEILTQKNINLRKTRDLLLPRLISGEIDVEDLDINTGEIDP